MFSALVLTSAIASTLSAQGTPARRTDATLPRAYGDINFAVAQPIGGDHHRTGDFQLLLQWRGHFASGELR